MSEDFAKPGTHWSKKYLNALSQIKFKTNPGKEKMQSLLRQLDFLKNEIREINKHIEELSQSKQYKNYCEILMSVPGIGLLSSMILLTEIYDINRFSHPDKLLSYFGIIPTEHSSGGRTRKGWLTSRKNNYLRKMIIESAWIAKTKDPTLAQCYNEAYMRSEPGRAIIKVAKKLIVRIHRIWTHEEKYVIGLA
jgi:transposase